ncbi:MULTISPECIES: pirin family protein [unclassified Caulobacter]|uniref:pirin family protein n=1 Tax=unclassified Caulobacter TaxID=2648921 RepID=UPI000D397484|nr:MULTISPECIES: pirin family protein [unclassified Caulobacter]PTS81692.1 quercetin 2,3-dioxygenase [Caulobacter sp. HMWF009]PTT06061.1 quercetin 2,3-dioxygenase [Caulobacter sp. HMWF025]PTT72207.1 quercetin 2,3-dioxygenase [Pseudomonas sp. HMWF010]
MSLRPVVKIVKGVPASDGDGVRLTRMLGTAEAQMFDPFLMLDCFDNDQASDYMGGFPDHPHRGFETVTYMLEGRMRHRDNTGREGVIGPGGIQWMRAGRGIVHSEMPEQSEGRMRGFQLWVNLPAKLKMSAPGYSEFESDAIPVEAREGGVSVKVISGVTDGGTVGPIGGGAVDALYFDVVLPAGTRFEEPVGSDRNAMLAVYEGQVRVAGGRIDALSGVFLGAGERVLVEAVTDARVLLLAGRPIGEPVFWHGPFVMNSRDEIVQAFNDFQSGRF